MRLMIKLAPFKWVPGSPLFTLNGTQPVSRRTFLNLFLRKAMSVLSPHVFSGHSFRRGGAQSLFDAGVPLDTIRDIGRWKSDIVMRRYYGYTVEQLSSLSLQMAIGTPRQRLDFYLLRNPSHS